MPIYAYKCESCGYRQDILRKVSDPVLGTCPACGAERFAKQVTAAGFQLKGSGWYATDFRGGKPNADTDKSDKPEKSDKTEAAAKPGEATASTPQATAPDSAGSPPKAGSSPAGPT